MYNDLNASLILFKNTFLPKAATTSLNPQMRFHTHPQNLFTHVNMWRKNFLCAQHHYHLRIMYIHCTKYHISFLEIVFIIAELIYWYIFHCLCRCLTFIVHACIDNPGILFNSILCFSILFTFNRAKLVFCVCMCLPWPWSGIETAAGGVGPQVDLLSRYFKHYRRIRYSDLERGKSLKSASVVP